MSPDRVLIVQDWVRWKHRFTLLVLALIATTIVSVCIGLGALWYSSDQRADRVAADNIQAEAFAEVNRQLIIDGCVDVEALRAGIRAFVEGLIVGAPADRQAEILGAFDTAAPQRDCTKIGETP